MYRRILVGYLENDHGHDALALGTALARATGAELIPATAPERGRDLGELARAHEADLIVLGPTHRSGLGRVIPGSTLERLLGESPCAVAVAPAGFAEPGGGEESWRPLQAVGDDPGLRVVGVGYDGSPAAAHALECAAELALRNRAGMRVYAVAPKRPQVPGAEAPSPGNGSSSDGEALRQALHKAVAELPPEARALPVFKRGWAADELIKAASTGVDLLLLGSRPGGPLKRTLHNSVSSGVILRAPCPVLVVPTEIAAAT